MNIKIELTKEEAIAILRVLSRHPFDEVAQLMKKIEEQGNEQIAAAEAETAKTEDEQASQNEVV